MVENIMLPLVLFRRTYLTVLFFFLTAFASRCVISSEKNIYFYHFFPAALKWKPLRQTMIESSAIYLKLKRWKPLKNSLLHWNTRTLMHMCVNSLQLANTFSGLWRALHNPEQELKMHLLSDCFCKWMSSCITVPALTAKTNALINQYIYNINLRNTASLNLLTDFQPSQQEILGGILLQTKDLLKSHIFKFCGLNIKRAGNTVRSHLGWTQAKVS